MNEDKVKLPAIQFYPADWQKDPGVRASSLQARGLWAEMLWLMHHAEPYGHLIINGKAIDERTLSRLVGAEMKRVCASLKELESNGVFSRTKDGTIYSRRMVKDAYLRAVRAKAGSIGGKATSSILLGNLLKQKEQQNTPSSSSDVKSLKLKPLSRKTGVKRQTAHANDGPSTAWLAPESPGQETASPGTPPEPIREFYAWVKDHVPRWATKKAQAKWRDPDDRKALEDIFRIRAIFEIQACWYLYIRPGTKNYDYAVGQRFTMQEFKRQIEYLVTDEDYPKFKRRFMEQQSSLVST